MDEPGLEGSSNKNEKGERKIEPPPNVNKTHDNEECPPQSTAADLQDNERCQFQAVYNDLQNYENFCIWRCDEKKRNAGTKDECIFCIFHDRTQPYWDSQTLERFEAKIKEHDSSKKTLFCIGYFFPMNLSFNRSKDKEGHTYDYPIYLCDAEFVGTVEFSYCKFNKPFNLSGAVFRNQALFRYAKFTGQFYPRNTRFLGNVNFRGTEFHNADFHDTVFDDKANFHEVEFKGLKTRFLDVRFQGKTKFQDTKFCGGTEFRGTTFREAKFSQDVEFKKLTKFRSVVFENGENTDFAATDLSNVSFLSTDISHIRFHDNANWGGDDGLTVIDERELKSNDKGEGKLEDKRFLFSWNQFPDDDTSRIQLLDFLKINFGIAMDMNASYSKTPDGKEVTLYNASKTSCANLHTVIIKLNDKESRASLKIDGQVRYQFYTEKSETETKIFYSHYPLIESVKAVYRGLRENYEYRLRYDEAGIFFVKEMELKRLYNMKQTQESQKMVLNLLPDIKPSQGTLVPPIKNNWARRNIFSITAWYRNLAFYGEDLKRPVIAGIIIVTLSTFFWLIQINPLGDPSFTNTVGLANAKNTTAWTKAFERTMADFLPLLSVNLGSSVIDFIIKIVGGAVTFGLLAIGLRRKFERRFRH